MLEQKNNAPRRYFVDAQGHRVLIGLSLEETTEFEALDLSPAQVGSGAGGERTAIRETRWGELYAKHEQAWRTWIAQSRAEQAADLGFVNHS